MNIDYHEGFEDGLREAEKRVERLLWVFGMKKEIVLSAIRGKSV